MQELGFEFTSVAASDVVRAIQLSLTPVFLLNGLGVLLGMMTTRLARIVDRARVLEQRLLEVSPNEVADLRSDLDVLSRRARLINRAITLGTVSALLVTSIVALLFATAFIAIRLGPPIAVVFIVAMLSLFGALWYFLTEVRIATVTLRFGGQRRP
ncbi:MAG: DUF2721 domain-containing protein [Nevskiaceae bacterium]|jgi:hypothetical protein|nr:DUF2721 domain-containing protein [Nevskiaceae bacterium]